MKKRALLPSSTHPRTAWFCYMSLRGLWKVECVLYSCQSAPKLHPRNYKTDLNGMLYSWSRLEIEGSFNHVCSVGLRIGLPKLTSFSIVRAVHRAEKSATSVTRNVDLRMIWKFFVWFIFKRAQRTILWPCTLIGLRQLISIYSKFKSGQIGYAKCMECTYPVSLTETQNSVTYW
jgi:hypothetical protein